MNSGGSFNHFTSHVVRQAIDLGVQEQHIEFLRGAYGSRLNAMDTALKKHLGDLAHWHCPDGGYFFWIGLPKDYNCRELVSNVPDFKIGAAHYVEPGCERLDSTPP